MKYKSEIDRRSQYPIRASKRVQEIIEMRDKYKSGKITIDNYLAYLNNCRFNFDNVGEFNNQKYFKR